MAEEASTPTLRHRFENASIGDRYQDPDGNTWVVADLTESPSAGVRADQSRTSDRDAMLVTEYGPDDVDWDDLTYWQNLKWSEFAPLEPRPELTQRITKERQVQREIAEIMSQVPADQHRALYNATHAVGRYTERILTNQAQLERDSADRAGEMRKVVEIVGTQDKAAKVLGMNQSTLSRALRPRT